MPQYFDTLEDYQSNCSFWGELERRLDAMFTPNPWIFQFAYQPDPNVQRYVITFRNFDNSDHYTVEFDPSIPGHYRFP